MPQGLLRQPLFLGAIRNDTAVTTSACTNVRSIARKIIARVEFTETCWLWTGTLGGGGYGQLSHRDVAGVHTHMAHRAMYELLVGPISSDLELDHVCRVRRCVRPAHMEPVTHSVNRQRSHGHATSSPGPYHRKRKIGEFNDTDTRVLFAILGGTRLLGDLLVAVGRSKATVHASLERLREADLVTWEVGCAGTLRPLVATRSVVASTPSGPRATGFTRPACCPLDAGGADGATGRT